MGQGIQKRDEKGRLFKGQPPINPKGRPPGGPDIRREFKDLKTVLIEHNFDPREAMILLAQHPKSSVRIQATKALLERVEPTLRSTEHTGKITVNHDIDEIKSVMKDLITAHKSEY
jgi:hypothetical protein